MNDLALPEGWAWKKLGEILELIQNGISSSQNDEKRGYPVSRIETIQNQNFNMNRIKHVDIDEKTAQKFRYQLNDIVFSHINSIDRLGKVAIFENQIEGLLHGVNLLRFRFNDFVFEKFAYYYFQTDICRTFYEKKIQKAINQASINQKAIKEIQIPLPLKDEQRRIVAKIDAAFSRLDEAIHLQKQNIQRTGEMKKSVLEEVFGGEKTDFKELPIELVFKIKSGEFLSAKNMQDGEYKVYGGNGVMGNHSDFNLEGTHVIIGRVGALCGNVRLVQGKKWITDNAFFVSELLEEVDLKFLVHQLVLIDLNRTANQAAQPVISYKGIKNIFLKIPSPAIQQQIVRHLDRTFAQLDALHAEQTTRLQHLESLKSSILAEAFQGKL